MSLVLGQRIPLSIIKHSLEQDRLHHSLWFHGPKSVGKMETAIKVAKSVLCQNNQSKSSASNFYCDKCSDCINIALWRHRNFIVLATDDRLKNIAFYQYLLNENITTRPQTIVFFLLKEIYHLLYRHNRGFLLLLERPKKSYSEGEKISMKALETLMQSVYLSLEKFYQHPQDASILTTDNFYTQLKTLQNCLDRTLVNKNALEKALRYFVTTSNSVHKNILVLQNIENWSLELQTRLLKTVEEVPENALIILLTENLPPNTNQQNALSTLKSRCLFLEFKALTPKINEKILVDKFGLSLPMESALKEKIANSNNLQECMQWILKDANLNNKVADLDALFLQKRGSIYALVEKIEKNEKENGLENLCHSTLQWLQKNVEQSSNIDIYQGIAIHKLINEIQNKKQRLNISDKNLSIKLLCSIQNVL